MYSNTKDNAILSNVTALVRVLDEMKERWITSYHEAGHAIVSIALGEGNQRRIEISGTNDAPLLGTHVVGRLSPTGHPGLEAFQAITDFLTSAAGWLAECRLMSEEPDWGEFYYSLTGCGPDSAYANLSLIRFSSALGRPQPTPSMISSAEAFAEAILRDDRIWHSITSLAVDVFKTSIVEDLTTFNTSPILCDDLRLFVRKWSGRLKRWHPTADEVYKFSNSSTRS